MLAHETQDKTEQNTRKELVTVLHWQICWMIDKMYIFFLISNYSKAITMTFADETQAKTRHNTRKGLSLPCKAIYVEQFITCIKSKNIKLFQWFTKGSHNAIFAMRACIIKLTETHVKYSLLLTIFSYEYSWLS